MLRHIRDKGCKEKEKTVFKCLQCSKEYIFKSRLDKHLQTHSVSKTCMCGKTFRRIYHFSSHQKSCPNINADNTSDSTATFNDMPSVSNVSAEQQYEEMTEEERTLDFEIDDEVMSDVLPLQSELEDESVELDELEEHIDVATSFTPSRNESTEKIEIGGSSLTPTPARDPNYWKTYREYREKKSNLESIISSMSSPIKKES